MPVGDDSVWQIVMFDLPVKTKVQRKLATNFRNALLDLGFVMQQFSVYVQYFPSGARAVPVVKKIRSQVPPSGQVRIVTVTDTQWSKSFRFVAAEEQKPEEPPSQLQIF